MILCDAGVLLCLVDCKQPQHQNLLHTKIFKAGKF